MHKRSPLTVEFAVVLLFAAQPVFAGVLVTTSGNQAFASISLGDSGKTYAADVTVTFDTPVNLSPAELNLSATLVDPDDPAIAARLPPCMVPLLGCVRVDPAFPVLITVEPLNLPWLFASGFESGDVAGNLSFSNTYEFEVHTPNLAYVTWSSYRLFKAPVDGTFDDITDSILPGSVRARGRGGSFSQFAVLKDTRRSLSVELLKEANLQTRILGGILSDALRADLLGLVAALQTAVLALNYTAAIVQLDELIATIQAHAGGDIANAWSSDRTLVNDAGEMLSLAQTLRYTLVRLQNGH